MPRPAWRTGRERRATAINKFGAWFLVSHTARIMRSMAGFEHLLKAYEVGDQLDDIASADPPAYLRRCFAEGSSAAVLSWMRVQQLAVCAMVLDAVVNDRDYEFFERELIAD